VTAPSASAGRASLTRDGGRAVDKQARRVAIVHRQTRPTLAVAAAFTFAAGVAVVVPHRTGSWLPLHLFLVGGLLTAISGATQFLAVTWSAALPPPDALVRAQRLLLAAGVLGLGVGRELDAPSAVLGAAGLSVIASLVLLHVALVRIRSTAKLDRFRPAIDGYLVAVTFGLVGCVAGIVMASGVSGGRGDLWRAAHLSANLLGLVGIVIAATLPYMVATQVRCKMSRRATPRALRSTTGLLAAATVLACAGSLWDRSAAIGLGFGLYAVGIAATVWLCPRIQFRQLRWAGHRLGLVAMGVVWWIGTTAALAVMAGAGQTLPSELLLALVIGGYAQMLAGSMAYLAPVLRGGGHERLTAGFRLTRSPVALAAANAAALGALAGAAVVTTAALAIWLVDAAVRAALLLTASDGEPLVTRR
jgi:nitrite reductase (NO-forming)